MTNNNSETKYCLAIYNCRNVKGGLFSIDISEDVILMCKLSPDDYDIPDTIELKRNEGINCSIGKLYTDDRNNNIQVIETAVDIIFIYKESRDIPASKILIFEKIA